jgi:hypothetical protein
VALTPKEMQMAYEDHIARKSVQKRSDGPDLDTLRAEVAVSRKALQDIVLPYLQSIASENPNFQVSRATDMDSGETAGVTFRIEGKKWYSITTAGSAVTVTEHSGTGRIGGRAIGRAVGITTSADLTEDKVSDLVLKVVTDQNI